MPNFIDPPNGPRREPRTQSDARPNGDGIASDASDLSRLSAPRCDGDDRWAQRLPPSHRDSGTDDPTPPTNPEQPRKVPTWIARYLSGEPLGPCLINPDVERRRDPVLLALLREFNQNEPVEEKKWKPTSDQCRFVIRTRSLAQQLSPVTLRMRLSAPEEAQGRIEAEEAFTRNFSLALSNLLVHRYEGGAPVVSLGSNRDFGNPSKNPKSDILTAQWLVESLILALPRMPSLVKPIIASASAIRAQEIDTERERGIPERMQGIHFGAKVNTHLTMATVMAFCYAQDDEALKGQIARLFSVLTGIREDVCRRGLEAGELELRLAQFPLQDRAAPHLNGTVEKKKPEDPA